MVSGFFFWLLRDDLDHHLPLFPLQIDRVSIDSGENTLILYIFFFFFKKAQTNRQLDSFRITDLANGMCEPLLALPYAVGKRRFRYLGDSGYMITVCIIL